MITERAYEDLVRNGESEIFANNADKFMLS